VPNSPADALLADHGAGAFDVAVIGAGPAGMAAAGAAAAAGATVALVDLGVRTGGQYWRNRGAADNGAHHHDWSTYTELRADLDRRADRITHLAQHSVWHIEPGADGARFTVHTTVDGDSHALTARTLVVATGAYDRQLPFPGWTLPGVFAAGALQALLKGHGVVAGRRIAVGGTGPFLLAVAAGLAEAGAEVVGVFDAGSPLAFGRFPGPLLRNPAKLAEGAGFARTLLRRRIPVHTRTAIIAANGTQEVTSATVARVDRDWRPLSDTARTVACDTVAVGYGFTPQLEIPLQLGCGTHRDLDGSLVADADPGQRSTVAGVYLAGEVCGVSGAAAAVAEGRIAGAHAAREAIGAALDITAVSRAERRRAALGGFAAAMHRATPIRSGWTRWLRPDTLVCRCEEVSAAQVDVAVDELGAADPRAVKLYARPGMGPCQGRVCGFATSCLVAARSGREPTAAELAGLGGRPIAAPIRLGELAAEDQYNVTQHML
jgi:thioredoxin reductase